MIVNRNDALAEWKVYSADEFRKEFAVKEERDDDECDEEFITRHLEADSRKFTMEFFESLDGNAYEEYWIIREVN
jgi:hypothetical protein